MLDWDNIRVKLKLSEVSDLSRKGRPVRFRPE